MKLLSGPYILESGLQMWRVELTEEEKRRAAELKREFNCRWKEQDQDRCGSSELLDRRSGI